MEKSQRERENVKPEPKLQAVRTGKFGLVGEPGEKQKAGATASATSTGWFNNGWN
jgi:hypothetical protein